MGSCWIAEHDNGLPWHIVRIRGGRWSTHQLNDAVVVAGCEIGSVNLSEVNRKSLSRLTRIPHPRALSGRYWGPKYVTLHGSLRYVAFSLLPLVLGFLRHANKLGGSRKALEGRGERIGRKALEALSSLRLRHDHGLVILERVFGLEKQSPQVTGKLLASQAGPHNYKPAPFSPGDFSLVDRTSLNGPHTSRKSA